MPFSLLQLSMNNYRLWLLLAALGLLATHAYAADLFSTPVPENCPDPKQVAAAIHSESRDGAFSQTEFLFKYQSSIGKCMAAGIQPNQICEQAVACLNYWWSTICGSGLAQEIERTHQVKVGSFCFGFLGNLGGEFYETVGHLFRREL